MGCFPTQGAYRAWLPPTKQGLSSQLRKGGTALLVHTQRPSSAGLGTLCAFPSPRSLEAEKSRFLLPEGAQAVYVLGDAGWVPAEGTSCVAPCAPGALLTKHHEEPTCGISSSSDMRGMDTKRRKWGLALGQGEMVCVGA